MLKKIGPHLPQISSKTYDMRQKIPTQNTELLQQKLRVLKHEKEKK